MNVAYKFNKSTITRMTFSESKLFWNRSLFSPKYLENRLYITCSKILEKHDSTDIGLQFFNGSVLPNMKTGITVAMFIF